MVKTRITEIDGEGEDKGEIEHAEHPLFPLEDGDKTFEVSFIQITRVESGVQKFGPTIPAIELNTEDDIFNRWGGGHYILIARAATRGTGYPGRFKKHRRVNIPGIPKPLSPDPTLEEQKLASPQATAAAASAQAASPMGDPMSFFGVMMQMQAATLEKERLAAERAAQQNQQFMQMFMTIMQGSKTDSQNMMQMMMTMSAQSQQGMLQFISAMMANRGGGPEEMAKYAELLKALGVGGGEKKGGNGEGGASSESIGAMLENAADLVQGMVALKGAASPAPVATADPNAPPMGGAASLLKGMLR